LIEAGKCEMSACRNKQRVQEFGITIQRSITGSKTDVNRVVAGA
jgi:hypothetical protein